MSVVRLNKTNNYTVMSNYHLRDRELSLKAKGLPAKRYIKIYFDRNNKINNTKFVKKEV